MSITANLYDYMRRRHINIAEVAKEAGMTSRALNDCMNGNRNLLADEYGEICKAIDVAPSTFMEEA